MSNDERESPEVRARRRRVFHVWVGLTMVLGVIVGLLAPVAEAMGNVHRWVAGLAGGMAALLILGVVWLFIFVHRKRRS